MLSGEFLLFNRASLSNKMLLKKNWKLSKNVKVISTKGLTKDMINKFNILNGAKYLQEYFKIILYLYQLKNTQ